MDGHPLQNRADRVRVLPTFNVYSDVHSKLGQIQT